MLKCFWILIQNPVGFLSFSFYQLWTPNLGQLNITKPERAKSLNLVPFSLSLQSEKIFVTNLRFSSWIFFLTKDLVTISSQKWVVKSICTTKISIRKSLYFQKLKFLINLFTIVILWRIPCYFVKVIYFYDKNVSSQIYISPFKIKNTLCNKNTFSLW